MPFRSPSIYWSIRSNKVENRDFREFSVMGSIRTCYFCLWTWFVFRYKTEQTYFYFRLLLWLVYNEEGCIIYTAFFILFYWLIVLVVCGETFFPKIEKFCFDNCGTAIDRSFPKRGGCGQFLPSVVYLISACGMGELAYSFPSTILIPGCAAEIKTVGSQTGQFDFGYLGVVNGPSLFI